MDFLNEEHLKVETPLTTDGRALVFNEVTGKPLFKVTYLPLTALKSLEVQNQVLENNLKHKITRIPGRQYIPPASIEDPTIALKKRIAELEAQAAAKPKEEAKQQKLAINEDK